MLNRDVVEFSIEAFVKEVIAMTLDGWAVCATNPGDAIGYGRCYTVSMYRDEDTLANLKTVSGNINEQPRLTRAEILQKARAARKPRFTTDEIVAE